LNIETRCENQTVVFGEAETQRARGTWVVRYEKMRRRKHQGTATTTTASPRALGPGAFRRRSRWPLMVWQLAVGIARPPTATRRVGDTQTHHTCVPSRCHKHTRLALSRTACTCPNQRGGVTRAHLQRRASTSRDAPPPPATHRHTPTPTRTSRHTRRILL